MEKHKGKYTEEEFNKLPKAIQEKLMQGRKERELRLKELATRGIEVSEVLSSTDRQKSISFNKVYNYVRPSLVTLKAQKQTSVSIDKVIEDTKKVLNNALQMLE